MPNVPTDPKDPLAAYWTKTVSELVEVDNNKISPEEAERHTIMSLLALSLVADFFNGNKRGSSGEYPWRSAQQSFDGHYHGDSIGDRYLGHNIAALAVDGRGEIIDFEFNHNELFNSSTEHAEARLVRRIFNLNQAFDHWDTIDEKDIVEVPYASVLSAVIIYTTLESCAQCSGVMTLGNVKSVVFLQSDPGQYRIGNIMYNLSNSMGVSHPSTHTVAPLDVQPLNKYGAPEPIPAELFSFSLKGELEAAYGVYRQGVNGKPFYIGPNTKPDHSSSITSFLCTDLAKEIFEKAAKQLSEMQLQYSDYPNSDENVALPVLTNAQVLKQARLFRIYAAKNARRGTSHR